MDARRSLEVGQVAFDPPVIAGIKASRGPRKEYWFWLTSGDIERVAVLGDAAMLAYAVIRAAAWGPRAKQWVTISPRAADAIGRGYRWWHAATTRLQESGLIDLCRQRGRAPRYRLRIEPAEDVPKVPAVPARPASVAGPDPLR